MFILKGRTDGSYNALLDSSWAWRQVVKVKDCQSQRFKHMLTVGLNFQLSE